MPFVINIALAAGASYLAAELVAARLEYEGFLKWVAVVIVALLLFVFGQPIVAAPFIDLLTEKVETIVAGKTESLGFVKSVLLAIWHGLLKSLLYAIGLAVTLGLFLATGVGGVFGTILTAIFLAYDGFDYPLARRVSGFGAKWRYLLLAHPGQTLGYAAGVTVMLLVPLAALIAPPFAAVGATLAYMDAETARARKAAREQGPPGPAANPEKA